jgi:hypothetical protein
VTQDILVSTRDEVGRLYHPFRLAPAPWGLGRPPGAFHGEPGFSSAVFLGEEYCSRPQNSLPSQAGVGGQALRRGVCRRLLGSRNFSVSGKDQAPVCFFYYLSCRVSGGQDVCSGRTFCTEPWCQWRGHLESRRPFFLAWGVVRETWGEGSPPPAYCSGEEGRG